jgi:hypothetical protein
MLWENFSRQRNRHVSVCENMIWRLYFAAGFFIMEKQNITTEIANLLQLEQAYRMQAREYINKLKSVITRRKQLEQLISPKKN